LIFRGSVDCTQLPHYSATEQSCHMHSRLLELNISDGDLQKSIVNKFGRWPPKKKKASQAPSGFSDSSVSSSSMRQGVLPLGRICSSLAKYLPFKLFKSACRSCCLLGIGYDVSLPPVRSISCGCCGLAF